MSFKRKTKKRRVLKNKRIKLFKLSNFPIIFLTIISFFFIWSFIYQLNSSDNVSSNINLEELLESKINSYEKTTGYRIKVEILNGCGQGKIAVMYQDFLRDQGFDVMNAKNAPSFDHDYSKILIHRGDIEMGYYLSNLMGINDSLIIKKLDEELMFDLSLIIGTDFEKLDSYDNVLQHYSIF